MANPSTSSQRENETQTEININFKKIIKNLVLDIQKAYTRGGRKRETGKKREKFHCLQT
jgi:hypothetical protein